MGATCYRAAPPAISYARLGEDSIYLDRGSDCRDLGIIMAAQDGGAARFLWVSEPTGNGYASKSAAGSGPKSKTSSRFSMTSCVRGLRSSPKFIGVQMNAVATATRAAGC